MIGKKEIALITNGKKLVDKYKPNFSKFIEHDFYVRFILVDDNGEFVKAVEYIVGAENWMDYIVNAGGDFENYKVDKIEFSASGR